MSELILIVQTHGQVEGGSEAILKEDPCIGDLHDALLALGHAIEQETLIFIDEIEDPLPRERHHPIPHIHHGSRIHVGHLYTIHTTVHFLGKSFDNNFPPGTRVASVKHWAATRFGMKPRDAAEHVLQLCGSPQRPSPDTAIHELVHGHDHKLCFDLVPEKRVEG